jgi:hypothetical protein
MHPQAIESALQTGRLRLARLRLNTTPARLQTPLSPKHRIAPFREQLQLVVALRIGSALSALSKSYSNLALQEGRSRYLVT